MENVELRTTLSMVDMELELELDDGQCRLTVTDTVEYKQVTLVCSPEQAAAIWYLAIAGDSASWPSWLSAICREISAQSRKGWRAGGARV